MRRQLLRLTIFPPDSALQPEGLHHTRGVAASGFRPLRNIPTAASCRSLGRVSVPVWLIILSDQLPIEALVGHYPTNKLMGRGLILRRKLSRRGHLFPLLHRAVVLFGISGSFLPLSRTQGQITHVLLTRAPLY